MQRLRTAFLLGHALASQRPQRVKQLLARLRQQAKRRRHRDIGDDMRGVLEPQPILDQPQTPRLAHQGIEHLLEPLGSQTIAKIGHRGVMGQRAFQAQTQKEPMGDVKTHRPDDFTVREFIVPLQQFQLQQNHGIQRRSPLIG